MYRKILATIPTPFRRRGWVLALNIVLRAVLNFFGVALLVPLLVLLLDQEALLADARFSAVYQFLGCESYREFVLYVVGAIVLAVVAKNLANLALYRYERDFIYELYKSISRRLYIGYFGRGYAFVKQNNSIELSRRVNLVSLSFVVGVLRPMATIVGEAILLLLIVVAMALYNVVAVGCAILILIPTSWAYYRFIRRRMSQYGREENEAHKMRFRSVTESFRGYADVEVNNAFERMLRDFDSQTQSLVNMQRRNAMLSMIPSHIMEVAVVGGMSLLVLVGLYYSMVDVKILFGVFAIAIMRLMPSLRSLLSAYMAINQNSYTLDVIAEADEVCQAKPTEQRLNLKFHLELRNLSFSYRDENVIQDLTLKINRGDKIGIQGVSGRGKSTLINLLLGLLEPTSGKILIDGVELNSTNRRMWQNAVGYVPQNLFLLDASLKENIAFGVESEKIDIERLQQAIQMASLEGVVESLPEGLDSNVGEGGCRLSGGERQRIGIARALYRQPDVLFLDEATSALDLETERQITDSIKQLSEQNPDLTIVIVAHRLSSFDCCDYTINL